MPFVAIVPVLLVGLALLGTLLACAFAPQLPAVLRVFAAVCFVPVILFCCFGFMATFEPLEPAVQMTWRVIYSLMAVSCIGAIARLAFAKKRLSSSTEPPKRP
jgi:hypothetical protein